MDRDEELRLIDEARRRALEKVPDADGAPVRRDASWYTEPGRLEREIDALFRRRPLFVGFASQVREPGDHVTHDLGPLPILVTRDRAGTLRAFTNACRHRGARLESAACGRGKKRIVCPYHGWTYDLDGSLLKITHEAGFAGVERGSLGLIELPVAERAGMIFAIATPGLAADFDALLGPFVRDLEAFGFGEHVLFEPSLRVREVAINWKLMIESSYESYHFEFLHAKTVGPLFAPNSGVFDWAEPHARMVLIKRSVASLEEADRASWSLRQHANIIYGVFPSLLVLVQPDHAMVTATFPVSADRSRILAGMLIPEPPATEKAVAHWKRNEAIFWGAIDEDLSMTASVQANLSSGAVPHVYFGSNEHLLSKFARALDAALG